MYNGKSRHIRRRHNTIKQQLSTGVISVDFVKSKDNIADPLTKGLNRELVEMDIKVRTEMCLEDSCVRYVIVYTNGRIVQGHRVYCLASRVNIFSQGKVQRVTPTSPVQVSTVASITMSVSPFVINFVHVGNCWI